MVLSAFSIILPSCCFSSKILISHITPKSVLVTREKQMCRPACAYAQADLHYCFSLSRSSNSSTSYIQTVKIQESLIGLTGWFGAVLVADIGFRMQRFR